MEIKKYLKTNWLFCFLFVLVVAVFFILRLHNVRVYNTWWADDGGGHIQYEQTILKNHRLPTPTETYLAWHEPAFYIILAGWLGLGERLGFLSIDWWASLNIIVNLFFLVIIWLLSYFYLEKKNKWLALLNVFIFSILFVSVKLSAYVNNELLNQTLILLLIFLFYRWRLLSPGKTKLVFIWSVILGLALLVKLTSTIVLLAALIIWLVELIGQKKKFLVQYLAICFVIVVAINLPWLFHKHQIFGQSFSINLYETLPKQNIFTSEAWQYFFSFNYHFVTDHPYWFSLPHSYWTVLISDTFGDYYNLFNNVDRINALPDNLKILIDNGRYTTPQLWETLIWTNRVGLVVYLIWLIGFGGWLVNHLKQKKYQPYTIFLLLALVGGWAALLFNNLRLPYLERGVLKAHFIYFTFPLLTLLSYIWWFRLIKKTWLLVVITLVPFLFYLFMGWPMLYLQ